jgi:asparagine synthetase B (glutamine-hydrolysing)
MCGILFCLFASLKEEGSYVEFVKRCRAMVQRRGPDLQADHRCEDGIILHCFSSVLWLQVNMQKNVLFNLPMF